MKPKSSPQEPLFRLLSAAREDVPVAVEEIPLGLARRVASHWLATADSATSPWLVPSWRALLAAAALVLISLSLNRHVFQSNTEPDVLVARSLMNTILAK